MNIKEIFEELDNTEGYDFNFSTQDEDLSLDNIKSLSYFIENILDGNDNFEIEELDNQGTQVVLKI